MKVLALTGGIASGKSTVAEMLRREHGTPVLDADALYHQLLLPVAHNPSPLALQIATLFPGVLAADGTIDRHQLREHIFADPEARLRLEHLTHPQISAAAEQELKKLAAAATPVAFYDIPLLFEKGLETRFAGVVLVWVPAALQLERLARRDGLALSAAEQRLAAQLRLDAKRAKATWIIDNSGSREATRQQVAALAAELGLPPRSSVMPGA